MVAAGAFAAAAGTAWATGAVSSIVGAAGTINGCYRAAGGGDDEGRQGQLRVVVAGEQCKKNELAIQWSQKGPKGDTGALGIAGTAGLAGAVGPAGLKGDPGARGAAGAKGDTGTAGADGAPGATGAQGSQGLQGPAGQSGIGLAGQTCAQGTFVSGFDAASNVVCSTSGTGGGGGSGGDPGSGSGTLIVSPMFLDFGSVPVSQSSLDQTITVTSVGGPVFGVDTGLDVLPSDAGFAITSHTCTTSLVPGLSTLAAGQSCEIDVMFAPVVPGLKPAMLSITTNAQPPTLYVQLSGTGT